MEQGDTCGGIVRSHDRSGEGRGRDERERDCGRSAAEADPPKLGGVCCNAS
jgi:hypothetical protein